MKRYKSLIFLLVSIFILPLFGVACNEVAFEDVAYEASGKTTTEVMEIVDSARLQVISTSVKMKLNTKIEYNFYKTRDESFETKNFTKEMISFVGKDSDDCFFNNYEKVYENGKLKNDTEIIYEKQVDNYITNSYCYTYSVNYQGDDEEETEYLKEKTSTTVTNLYAEVIKKFNANEFENVYEKAFEGVNYYKLNASPNEIKKRFSADENVGSKPQLFIKNKQHDYLGFFTCEIGLKESGEATYIVYYTLDYSVYNTNREKYLTVSLKTTLDKYGDDVVVSGVEDKDSFVANAFVNTMKDSNSYCIYKPIIDNVISDDVYSVLQIRKNHGTVDYFDYAVKVQSVSSDDTYYYIKTEFDENVVNHVAYKITDTTNKIWQVEDNFLLDLLSFDFSLKYKGRVAETANSSNYYYQFGEINYIKVYTSYNEVSQIETAGKKLKIEDYGYFDNDIDVIWNVAEYNVAT